ncbi:MAG TPA: pentapeptide repeat-containing protein [Puia sp.]|nr:pentapeptide repeat-containing protein [Puia sp.]
MDHCITDQTFEKKDFTEDPLKKGEYENCIFRHCNFSRSDLAEMVFIDCKMLGLHFEDCNEFGLSFKIEGCIVDQTSFYRTKLKKTIFKNSQFKEADLRTAYNYSIDPDKNRIKKARFSSAGLSGLLDKYNLQID